ncbi:MAG: glycosyltransferase [Candidatus Hydrogenedens sp.]|nr:glycosyltransferase [Candidatus Hydrogenedens sp.]
MFELLRWLALIPLLPIAAYACVVCGYLGLLGLGAWLFRPKKGPLTECPRFALLIPAHNESGQIADILNAAAAMDYPADRKQVIVVADNCSDDTADIARAHGALVLERHDPEHPGKGEALNWCLRSQEALLRGMDHIALVDADMIIHPAFLRELAESLAHPDCQVVQSLNTVSNPEETWRTAFGYMGFTTINFVRPAGREFLGGTAELKGSGMAFRAPLLLEYGWPCNSLAEDVEFSKRLLMDGILVRFNPGALVTSPIPVQTAQADVQQRRWEGGKVHIFKHYFGPVLSRALQRPSLANWDAVLDMLVPPQSLLFLVLAAGLVLGAIAGPGWFALLAACACAAGFCIASGLILQRAPLQVWLYLAALPLFIAWKIPLYLKLLAQKGEQAWQRTPRDNEVE